MKSNYNGEAEYYSVNNENIRCELCPNYCLIPPGRSGICNVRANTGGKIHLPYYGRITSLCLDPVEKKPLFHFFPGREILSVGFAGCSFKCPFCQNHSLSRIEAGIHTESMLPEDIVRIAAHKKSFGIAYTYSEPLIHFEYLKRTSILAKKSGLKNVIVTNGHLNKKPAEELLEYVDAANIDLKSFSKDFYSEELGGNLETVKEFIKTAYRKCFIEITTLVIPGKNDSSDEIEGIARFIAGIDPSIPYHLSCYHPAYKYTIPPTSLKSIMELQKTAQKHLKWVFPGNTAGIDQNSRCPECGNLLIERSGYSSKIVGIENGECTGCKINLQIFGI